MYIRNGFMKMSNWLSKLFICCNSHQVWWAMHSTNTKYLHIIASSLTGPLYLFVLHKLDWIGSNLCSGLLIQSPTAPRSSKKINMCLLTSASDKLSLGKKEKRGHGGAWVIRHGLYSILPVTIVAISHLNESGSMTRGITCLQTVILYWLLSMAWTLESSFTGTEGSMMHLFPYSYSFIALDNVQ